MEPKFKENDYIINHASGDMAIIDSVAKKGYYHFKVYYSGMFEEFKDAKDKLNDLQINYQKFWDLCTDDEKKIIDKAIEENEQSNK